MTSFQCPLCGVRMKKIIPVLLALVAATGCAGPLRVSPMGSAVYVPGIALAGDLGNTAATPYVESITGTTPIAITPGTLQWLAATSSPTLTQAAPGSDVATGDIGITAQSPYASAVTNVVGGGLRLTFAAPLSGTTESYLKFFRGATAEGEIGPFPGNSAYMGLWFGTSASTPSGTNYSLISNGSTATGINVPTGGSIGLSVNGSNVDTVTASLTTLGSSATTVGGTLAVSSTIGGTSGTAAWAWCTTTQALTSGSNVILANTVYNCPHITFTGSLTGAGTSVTFPSTNGACWDLDFSAVSTITDSIALKANSQTWGTAVASVGTEFPHVCYSATVGRLVGVAMTE
jgi:hypothetical protein